MGRQVVKYERNRICRCGGIGRHKGLKIPRRKKRTGSTPVSGTRKETAFVYRTKAVSFQLNPSFVRNKSIFDG